MPFEVVEWWPVCVCLLSRLPLVGVLQGWLARLHAFLDHPPKTSSPLSPRATSAGGGADFHLQGYTQLLLAPHFIQLAVTLPQPVENKLAVAFAPFSEPPPKKAKRGVPQFNTTAFFDTANRCSNTHCIYPPGHDGLCSHMKVAGRRTSRSAAHAAAA